MKSISAPLLSHLAQTTTTLATIWKIVRTDGEGFFFTDHDADILYDGDTYKATNAYNRSAVQNNASLAVDNMDIMGIFDDDSITEVDIRAGLFDYAEIFIGVINWSDPSQGILRSRRGHLGEVISTPQGYFRSEMRGMTQNLAQNIGEIYQAECRADLGDSRCTIPIRPPLRQNLTQYAVGERIRVPTDLTVVTTIGGEPTQDAYENRVYRCSSAGITGPTQPVYNEGIGATTTEQAFKASATLTFTGQPSNNQTITVDSKVYRFQTVLTNVDGNVLIGATAADSVANMLAAMTLGAGSGTLYAAATTAHTTVDFALGNTNLKITATAKTGGAAGNSLAVNENIGNATWGSGVTSLQGGVDGAVFVSENSYTRQATISTVLDNAAFTISVSEARAVDDWFNGGGLIFESGDNAGFAIEIRDWVQSTSRVDIFLPAPFPVQVGDKIRLYPGCDKRSETCFARFANILNFRGEPFVPGQDEIANYPDAQ